MLRPLPLALAGLLLAALSPRAAAAPRLDELAEARAAFERAAATGSLADRNAALDRLVALADPGAVAELEAEFARVSSTVREARDEAYKLGYRLDRQEALAAEMKLRLERDRSLEDAVERQVRRTEELREQLGREQRRLAELEPWYEALGAGAERFFAALQPAKRKKAEGGIWKDLEDSPQLAGRLAAIELLGFCGGEGTAVDLQEHLVAACKERAKLERDLPKLMVEVRKMEQRIQKEQDQNEGRHSQASQQQYDRARQEASDTQRALSLLGYVADACVEAGARALSREQGAVLERSLQKLMRAQGKAQHGARQRTLRMLGTSSSEAVRSALHGLLAKEKEVTARAAIVDALSASGDREIVPMLLDPLLGDPEWLVRSRAAAALARLRVREAIPALIDRMAAEDGRLRTDVRAALASLTGQDFRTNVELWRRWWKQNEDGFVVPPLADVEAKASEEAKESVGVTFFGIETESRKVLFVLDLSRSMTFSMVPRNSPNDEDPSNPDMPQEGESSRLEEARRALTRALGGIEDGSVFNILFYATDVWSWNDRLIEMESDTRAEALRYVDSIEANGGTNIYGALLAALDMAGADGDDEWTDPAVDTIYFLSDGRASVGVTTDPDEILAFVRERNETAGITIHAIGLSGAQDAYLMRSLAEQNGGTYVAR